MMSQHTYELTGSPASTWLGAFITRAQYGDVELLLPYRDEFADEATIHCGIITAFADVVGLAVAESATHRRPVPQSLRLDYLSSARVGNELHASGRLIGECAQIEIRTNDDRALIARATVTFGERAAGIQPVLEQPMYPN